MRLDFNVLWVEDQPAAVDAQVKSIAQQMQAEGFNLVPRMCRSVDEVRALVADHVFADEIDLVLVDWDLGTGEHGEDAIAVVREAVLYKDVVFYSALNPVDALRELAFNQGSEGIYCSTREGLVDEVIGVFESLVKKVLDLDHTRGIVMGATSDIDQMVNDSLIAIYAMLNEAGKKAMLDKAGSYIERRITELTKAAEELKSATSIVAFIEAHMMLTANDRLRILAGVLQDEQLKAHGAYRSTVTTYQNKVVPYRNELGHVVLVPAGRPSVLITVEGKEVTLEETRELRRLILELRGDFRDLLAALRGGG